MILPKNRFQRRGFEWEDDLTKYINDHHKYGTAFNLGGSTKYIPDIFLSSLYFDPLKKSKIQMTLDGDQTQHDNNKWIYQNFVMAIECKYTTKNEIRIDKNDIDKCFEFLKYLVAYDRFVVLAIRFHPQGKLKQWFMTMKWNNQFLNSDYDYIYFNIIGEYSFRIRNDDGSSRKSTGHNIMDTRFFRDEFIKLTDGKYDIEDI